MNSNLLAPIESGQRRRVRWLVFAHAPALLLLLAGFYWPALAWFGLGGLLLLHAGLLWGTLNPHSALFGPVLRRLMSQEKVVWLTIDDGPSADTSAILELLARFQARATFFLVAERAQRDPDRVRAIVEAGHEVANHSATHPQQVFWCLSPSRMTQELVQAQQQLTALTGKPPRWFRAVVGHANPFVQPVLEVMRLRRVAWTARAYDAVDGNVQRVVGSLLRQVKPGAIVLLHEGASHGHNLAIIEALLAGLQSRGYRAVLPD